MSKSMFRHAAAAALAVAVAGPAAAQDDPNLTGLPAREAPAAPQEQFGAFGSGIQDLWIAATEFQGKLSGQADLNYSTFHYYNAPGSASPVRYFAQIPLPSGAQISFIECHVNDTVANDVTLGFQKYAHNLGTNAPASVFIRSWGSTGTSGFQQPSLVVAAADGEIRYSVGSDRFLYYLAADVAADTSFRGCNIRWARTVSPAPAVATFPNDVPTTSPVFRFVEAMAASGLTGGCGAGSFCPNNPVTRGQMAVFLSVALGLHFPN